MSFSRKGFVLSQSNGSPMTTKIFPVEATSQLAYFIGDAVIYGAGSNGKIVPLATSSAGGALGVITAVYKNNNGVPSPLTFSQPTNGPYLTSGQAGFAAVCIDPRAIYVAELDVTASVGLILSNVSVSAGTPNTRAGISGQNLKGTSIATTTNRAFKIVGIASNELINGGLLVDYPAGTGVLVKINNPQITQTTGY